eukprot:CAMPEP_0183303778 /NCGR_PEP_ID=MMETSP0160_2-20130417/9100_1 /TAXON_ID=2839 ORGANISM="Odontella Sinensis, Strain Grunow 1884" /NCGR_SAMPLE_ID=MMETSP0160_2 /ASSEMBLY_ACC=CAM_ASM_000250 /LENGTH=94 /DNA_ID=CAMNT_0025466735 /DNA_START=49 /DNA_END=333 /DNA_ORIENTATION=-
MTRRHISPNPQFLEASPVPPVPAFSGVFAPVASAVSPLGAPLVASTAAFVGGSSSSPTPAFSPPLDLALAMRSLMRSYRAWSLLDTDGMTCSNA